MRTLSQGNTKVVCESVEQKGVAADHYMVFDGKGDVMCEIHFQSGPVKEVGVNGAREEDVLSILIDRVRTFQGTKHACRETALALTKLDEAMHWLNHRDTERKQRGVKGTSKA